MDLQNRLVNVASKVASGSMYWPALAAEAERYAEERVAADRAGRAPVYQIQECAVCGHKWHGFDGDGCPCVHAPAKPALPEEVAEGCVRVTMPIFVNGNGEIVAYFFDRNGKTSCLFGGEDGWHLVNVTADIPLPKPVTVRGEATP